MFAFAVIIAGVVVRGSWRGDFRTDEAHKISESAFLGLWLRGDVRNPAWFELVLDRTNPPVGKYVFGAAILLAGQPLPPLPTLAVHNPHGVPPTHPKPLSAPYRPLLPAVRFASAAATAMTAALVTGMLARSAGWVAAAAALWFFAMNGLTRQYGAQGVFDPLFAFFFMSTIALVTMLTGMKSWRRIAAVAAAIGLVTALAFQTRLNGLFALLVALPFVWLALRSTPRIAIAATAILACTFAVTTLAVNPFYWSMPATPLQPFSAHAGPSRPFERLLQQKHDLEALALPLQEGRTFGRTPAEKVAYLFETMLSDVTGLLMMAAAIGGIIGLALRWRSLVPQLRMAMLISLTVVFTMTATLPMPWGRYLVVVTGPLALAGGFGAAEVARGFLGELRRAVAAARPGAPDKGAPKAKSR